MVVELTRKSHGRIQCTWSTRIYRSGKSRCMDKQIIIRKLPVNRLDCRECAYLSKTMKFFPHCIVHLIVFSGNKFLFYNNWKILQPFAVKNSSSLFMTIWHLSFGIFQFKLPSSLPFTFDSNWNSSSSQSRTLFPNLPQRICLKSRSFQWTLFIFHFFPFRQLISKQHNDKRNLLPCGGL